MILCLAGMYQRARVLVSSSAGLCLLVPPSFPGSSSFPLKVHYLLSRDCGRVVFPSRSAAATLQEWQSPCSSRHCCHPQSFQMTQKIRPRGGQTWNPSQMVNKIQKNTCKKTVFEYKIVKRVFCWTNNVTNSFDFEIHLAASRHLFAFPRHS